MWEVIDMDDSADTHDAVVFIAQCSIETKKPIYFRFSEDEVFLFASYDPITDQMIDDWYAAIKEEDDATD